MEELLDVRDGISVAKNLIVGVYMAAQSSTVPANDRAALCAVTNVARERLEAVAGALDALIANARRS